MDPERAAELLRAERLRIERALMTRQHQDDAEEADDQDPGNLGADLYQDELDEGLRGDLEVQQSRSQAPTRCSSAQSYTAERWVR